MTRGSTSAFSAATQAATVRPFLLFEGWFDSGPLLLWTGYGPLLWNGNSYTGAGDFIGISEIKESNGLESAGMTIELSGIPTATVSLALSEPYQNRVVRIWAGFFDANGQIVADPKAIFTGRADYVTVTDAGENCRVTLSVENHLVDLMRARARYYTHQDQQTDYPGDLFFSFVEQIQDKPFQWGPG